ncbi:MAG: hypothetical protein LQ343_000911 [Gyalolechia ehrenbergii]|nr:MAG: hypothetical protein LQ343_000911 [Gyalolechia ehrenbergii]
MSHFPGDRQTSSSGRGPAGQYSTPTRQRGNGHVQSPHDLTRQALTWEMRPTVSQEMGHQMTLSECSMELNRFRQSYQDLRARYAVVETERDRSRHECNQQYQRSQTLGLELERLQNELQVAKQRERELEVELEGSREALGQARATIQEQSRTIQGRRDAATRPASHHDALQSSQTVSRFVEDYGFGPRPISITRPDPRETLYAPPQLQATPYRSDNQSSRHPYSNDARNDASRQRQALVARSSDAEWDVQWPTEFSSLFARVERFCSDYFKTPNSEADRQWPLLLADNIARESHPDHVSSLVGDQRTRHLLITRIILSWLEAHCFHVRLIKGFSDHTDKAVYNLRRQVKQENSLDVRRGLAQAQADTIVELTRQPSFEAWKTDRIRDEVNRMMTRLTSALIPGTNLAFVGNTFESILADAWRIGLMMATRTLVFQMWFPPCATLFDPRSMLNRNPYELQGTPDELVQRRAKVSLGVTPHVTIKDLMKENEDSKTVHLANVILRR